VYRLLQSCRICANRNLIEILDLGVQSLTGVFPRSPGEKITAGPLKLAKCLDDGTGTYCGLVQLMHSYDLNELYGNNYGYRSGLNQSMVRHLHDKVKWIINRAPISRDDLIIDIGSNDSTLLQAYPSNMTSLYGVDPTGSKFQAYYPSHIKLLPEFFSAELIKNHEGNRKAKIITSIAMFYDLESPMDFMSQIYEILADDGLWVFEQSYMPTMLKQNSYDTICHEHLEYYSFKQIKYMADRVGFHIVDVELNAINGGSISVMAAKHPRADTSERVQDLLDEEAEFGLETLAPYDKFRERVFQQRDDLLKFFEDSRRSQKTIVGYGASTKGNVILQFCGISPRDLPCIAEVNEDKFGRYTPGTNIPIVAEEEARSMKPDYFMVLPWHFKDGIIRREGQFLKQGGMLVMPLPRIEVIQHDPLTVYKRTEKSNTLIFIPTYNERDNVEHLCSEILLLGLGVDILFIDDNSPDGTGAILDLLAKNDSSVHVVHRSRKLGIGSAHAEGIEWAYERGYQTLITMDSDFTHSPDRILELLKYGPDYDIVLGSRYLKDRSLLRWNLFRKMLTYAGHVLTRVFLGMKYDATGALRLYRLDRIPRQAFTLVHSLGYSFFFESLYILHRNGFRIKEFSIALPARTYGHSKMTYGEALRSVQRLMKLYLTRLFRHDQLQIRQSGKTLPSAVAYDRREWNDYWTKNNDVKFSVYDSIASFYRQFIIKPSLNRFIVKYFSHGSRVLHAGCGSGQVDMGINGKISIVALDLSLKALSIYKSVQKDSCRALQGSVFNIPLASGSLEGIYNLGVMEHFTEEEIGRILLEFNRVLRQGGMIVLFWPPEFGLSVMFLEAAHFILNRLLRINVILHPPEITRVRSPEQIVNYLTAGGFRLREYAFGIRDIFTHVVIVGEKICIPPAR
jgi:glycosyltransferase involved in cell wall biosynthesis